MKSGILFILSVALIFLSANVFTYSQSKTGVPHKNAPKTHGKQITQVSKINKAKSTGLKTTKVNAADKKISRTSKVGKSEKPVKNRTKKAENTKILKHHKIMQKKTQKKKSNNTPHKK